METPALDVLAGSLDACNVAMSMADIEGDTQIIDLLSMRSDVTGCVPFDEMTTVELEAAANALLAAMMVAKTTGIPMGDAVGRMVYRFALIDTQRRL